MDTPQGRIAGFTATIGMADTSLMVDGNRIHLTPGMSVQADIRTGRRRLIDFILSPVKKSQTKVCGRGDGRLSCH